jgi:predicted metal-dependent peptidase
MTTLTAAQRLVKNKLEIMRHPKWKAVSGVMMMGKTALDDSIPTAVTNGRDDLYNEKFVGKLNDAQLRFVILHENHGHKAKRHLTVWLKLFKENAARANRAADYVVNLELMDIDAGERFIEPVPNMLLDEKYRGMDTGEVYRLLKEEGDKSNGQGESFDSHDWQHAENLTDKEVEQLHQEVDRALREGVMRSINSGDPVDGSIMDLLTPRVNWSEYLNEYITTLWRSKQFNSWRRPNRRFIDSGLCMPSPDGETMGRLVVGIDASGSTLDTELFQAFITELVSLCKSVTPEVLDLLYWDTVVRRHEKYGVGEYDQLLTMTRPKGGGGTTASCVPEYLADNKITPECTVMLTDGYVGNSWGTWDHPVLWCIAGRNNTIAPVGKTINIQ